MTFEAIIYSSTARISGKMIVHTLPATDDKANNHYTATITPVQHSDQEALRAV